MSKPTESGKAQYQYMEAIMLELQKKQIHMSRSKNTVSAQVTFDEDFKGVKGRDYKVIIDASVYRKGSSEKVTKTSTGTCS